MPAVLAVAFSAVLVALQCGLLAGTLAVVSLPIDNSSAHLWVTAPGVTCLEAGTPIPEYWSARLVGPEIVNVEPYVQGLGNWHKPGGGSERCLLIGSRLHAGALGAMTELPAELRAQLAEPGTVAVDGGDLDRLGLGKDPVGKMAELNGQHVRVAGLMSGFKGLGAAYVFCSLETARQVLRLPGAQVTYLLASCRSPEDAEAVAARLDSTYHSDMLVMTSAQFSRLSRNYWLFKTGAGVALGFAALLGLLVGAVVTSQTLYAATAASLREYAVLRALGIPRWRLRSAVLAQSGWIGLIGVVLAVPAVFVLAAGARLCGAQVALGIVLLSGTAVVTLVMALLSGLGALRSLRLVEPATLLR